MTLHMNWIYKNCSINLRGVLTRIMNGFDGKKIVLLLTLSNFDWGVYILVKLLLFTALVSKFKTNVTVTVVLQPFTALGSSISKCTLGRK